MSWDDRMRDARARREKVMQSKRSEASRAETSFAGRPQGDDKEELDKLRLAVSGLPSRQVRAEPVVEKPRRSGVVLLALGIGILLGVGLMQLQRSFGTDVPLPADEAVTDVPATTAAQPAPVAEDTGAVVVEASIGPPALDRVSGLVDPDVVAAVIDVQTPEIDGTVSRSPTVALRAATAATDVVPSVEPPPIYVAPGAPPLEAAPEIATAVREPVVASALGAATETAPALPVRVVDIETLAELAITVPVGVSAPSLETAEGVATVPPERAAALEVAATLDVEVALLDPAAIPELASVSEISIAAPVRTVAPEADVAPVVATAAPAPIALPEPAVPEVSVITVPEGTDATAQDSAADVEIALLESEIVEAPETSVDDVPVPGNATRVSRPTWIFAAGTVSADVLENAQATTESLNLTLRAVNRVNFRISTNQVRYYDQDSAAAAQELAAQIGAVARDFSGAGIDAQPGTLEIYLAGQAVAARRSNPTPPQRSAPANTADDLRNSVINRIRAGLGN